MALNMSYGIKHPVGAPFGAPPGPINQRADVEIIQRLLNEHASKSGYPRLPVNGMATQETISAIRAFQQKVVGMKMPDGRVDPNGTTLRKLNESSGLPTGVFNPAGQDFNTRLQAFIDDAKTKFGVTITQKSFRKPEDAQKWHVAHMIYYNSYSNLKPAQWEVWEGDKVIKWSHLSSPTTIWQYVAWEDFLRDANGQVPVKQGNAWAPGRKPAEEQTRTQAYNILAAAGIGTDQTRPNDPHSGMVAPGYNGCGEPCRCGGNRSKHIAGVASDLGATGMSQLVQKLQQAGAGTLDQYLKKFGLHRPLLPSETWHVEATTP